MMENAILVRDLDCDIFSEAYIIFSDKDNTFMKKFVEEAKQKWSDKRLRCYFSKYLEDQLEKKKINYTIVPLDDIDTVWI